ncbi:sugar isomerase [candidate division MSBL1 archaeon SCGC-AAA259A05]|uniref:Sugar isomerase n=1 Tax=candidate division MSBL1 archaeon SCGC-AAA259A05 TaxID=1698259 RepID=A0A133UAD6_9EURY|nr:sugar isomerase [candidate division MSBL1 archaeon SCGC-AAA259A05]
MTVVENTEKEEPKNEFEGKFPKIGIRPAIDGRRAVRRTQKERTMVMAESTAEFLEENLRHPNGDTVECVVADSCIGGVVEARKAAAQFEEEGVEVSITVSPCWCYPTETMNMDPLMPKAIWGFNSTQRPGAVYLAALKSAHDQKGLPIFPIYGHDVKDPENTDISEDVKEKLLRFAKAGLAVATMRGKTYLSIGSVSMGIASSIVSDEFFEDYLGMRCKRVDMSEIIRRIEKKIYNEGEFEKALDWVKENFEEGSDPNPKESKFSKEEKEEIWETVVKMTIIMRDLMVGNPELKEKGYEEESLGHNAIAAGFQGQREWTDHFPNGDFSESILNSSFDWNGTREPYILATENDALNAVSMLFGKLLTKTAQIFADVRTYWSPESVKRITGKELTGRAKNGIIHLKNSGSVALDGSGQQMRNEEPAIKPFWEITEDEIEAMQEATTWRPALMDYFEGGGFSAQVKTEGEMPLTMSRINIVRGLGPALQIAEGHSVELSEGIHKTLDEMTDPTWPTTWFAPELTGEGAFKSVYSVMNNWGANHGAVSYGHIGGQLITLASMLRLPIAMHNVEEERIFRPSAWSAFGDICSKGADYRACENFGPLYKTKRE